MCDFSIAAAALSTVVGAVGQIQQGRQQAALYRHHSALADRRARLAEQAARAEAERVREEGAGLLARQRTGFAKSGVALAGTPLDVLGSTAAGIEQDAQGEIHAGTLAAAERRARAAELSFRAAGVAPRTAVGAGTSLLSGTARTFRQIGELRL